MALVRIEWHDQVAQVILDRPERLNAITAQLLSDLVDAGAELAQRPDCRAVVLSGEGRAFCAGIDLEALRDGPDSLQLERHDAEGANLPQRAVVQWRDCPVPVIAAIHGVAFGGGLQLALGADLRIVDPAARLSVRELQWGLVPDMGGMLLLPELVRPDRMAELVFTAREFDGVESVELGLCTTVADDPVKAALAQARTIAAMSPDAVRAAKRLMRDGVATSPAARAWRLRSESSEQIALLRGDNHREAVAAGMAKRLPRFSD